MVLSDPWTARRGPDPRRSAEDEPTLRRYVGPLLERVRLVLLVCLLTTLVAAIYAVTAAKVYEAEAQLLVTPVSRDDVALSGLGLIRDSPEPLRDVETVASLVATADVATAASRDMGVKTSPQALLDAITALPVANSNIISVRGMANTPAGAQMITNAFAVAAVQDRDRQLRRRLDETTKRLRTRITRGDGAREGESSLDAQIARLEGLRVSGDPTVSLETKAPPPSEPESPRVALIIAAGLFAGLVLGVGGVFTLQILDPRLRRVNQISDDLGLPILAHIPDVPGGNVGPLAPSRLPRSALDAYKALQFFMSLSHHLAQGSRALVITSPSRLEGKTTTALNLAVLLASSGRLVYLINADVNSSFDRDLTVAPAERNIDDVLGQGAKLEDALTSVPQYAGLSVLAGSGAYWQADDPSAIDRVIAQGKNQADFVIFDAGPPSGAAHVLPLAALADETLIVTRIGTTERRRLSDTVDLLERYEVRRVGIAVLGLPSSVGNGDGDSTPRGTVDRLTAGH